MSSFCLSSSLCHTKTSFPTWTLSPSFKEATSLMMIPLILTLLILLTVYIRTSPLKNTLACNLDTSLPGNMMEQEESLPMVELSDTGK